MTQLKGVLFDLDGTLLDSAPDICQALNHMLTDEGLPAVTLDQTKSMVGDGVMELCRRAFALTGRAAGEDLFPFVQKFVTYYRNLPPDPSQVFPGAREVLSDLQAKGIKLGVCTNKPESASVKILKSLDLIRYFGFIAGGDTFEVHKPHPGHVLGALKALDVEPGDSLFVGDGPNDVIASEKAGVAYVVMTHGYGVDLTQIDVSRQVKSFDSFASVVRQLGFVY